MLKYLLICFSFILSICYSNKVIANNWSLKVEPGLTIPLNNPQSQLFNLGGAAMVKALFGIGNYVDVGPTVGFVGLSSSKSNTLSKDLGTGWQFGGGFRIKRPHNNISKSAVYAVSPWIDVDLTYVRTGPLNRFGFSAGTGLSFPVDEDRKMWFGPFVRYSQIIQTEEDKIYDNRDAKILIAGLSFEFGSSNIPKKHNEITYIFLPQDCPPVPEVVPCPPVPEAVPCPPVPKAVPHLVEKIQFDWDSDVLTSYSIEILERTRKVLEDNKDYDVSIEGHASSEGQLQHNKDLSERRAKAVLEYLVDRGILRERLSAKGFGSSDPIEPNDTVRGRVANRRVVFKLKIVEEWGGVK